MTENCRINDCQKRLLVAALETIIEANKDFRDGMPESWDGDPLQDACDAAEKLLTDIVKDTEHG